MNLFTLPCTPDAFLNRFRFATETDTLERHQTAAKEAVFYSHISKDCFELYERPAFVKERTFYLGGILLRGAVAPKGEGECEIATELAQFPENRKTAVICLLLLIGSVIGTAMSGNLFATMLPLVALLCFFYLLADAFWSLIRINRLKKKWEVILAVARTGRPSDADFRAADPQSAPAEQIDYCPHCGAPLEAGARSCAGCGCDRGDEASWGYFFLGFFVPVAGLILYLVWKQSSPQKALSAGKGALTAVVLSVIATIAVLALFALSA